MTMKMRVFALITVVFMLTGILSGCAESYPPAPSEDPVTLRVVGAWEECLALDETARAFTARYPNCTIVYEYLQDYYQSAAKRMTGEDNIDLFFTTNIQADTEMLPYALDLMTCEKLDLSETFQGLIDNFSIREDGVNKNLYAIPLGAEMRGLYVNKTLLASLGLEVPSNQKELLDACEKLKENGYTAFHGNPGMFSQTLLYPWICNIVANADDYEATYAKVNNKEAGLSELFIEPYDFLYTLVENYYYDYKRAQNEQSLFTDSTDEAYSRDFLNIRAEGDIFTKYDDVGQVAFMPSTMSLMSTIERTKEDYHSEIEYVFVPAPVGKDGAFVYLSPAHGIAINNASQNIEWSVLFLDFLFTPENNKIFAKGFNVMPNTKDAFSYIRSIYDVPDERISHLGQVTFDYGFYSMMVKSLTAVSKGNNPSYMMPDENGTVTDKDGNKVSLYPLQHYLDELEESVKTQ